jgi:hypothetical protein
MWLEDLGNGQTEWRGKVEYVPSGEIRYFREWVSIVECLQQMLPNATTNPGVPHTAD